MRYSRNPRKDHKAFRRTAERTKKANITTRNIPRGGIRL